MLSDMTFSDLIRSAASARPEKAAVVVEGRTSSFLDLERESDRYAAALLRMGLRPGDHVALWGYRSELWIEAFFGIIKAGGIAVLINYGLTHNELAEQFRLADIRFILNGRNRYLKENPDGVQEICRELKLPERYAVRLDSPDLFPASAGEQDRIRALQTEEDVCRTAVIIFTTGTTSDPRAVMLSQYAMVNNVILQQRIDCMEESRTLCLALPLFHSFGLAMLLLHILNHSTVYLPDRLRAEPILDCISRYRLTDIASVASIYRAIFDSPDFDGKFSPYIYNCAIGGSPVAPDRLAEMELRCAHAEFHNGYGLSECSPYVSLPARGDSLDRRARSVGRPLPGVQVRILGRDGEPLLPGQAGEIVVRGFNLMNGYYRVPAEQQPVDPQGWLHTGDLGKMDADGYLYVLGRLKDLIIRCGENISPMEVESAILEYPGIREAKVLGIPDPDAGETIAACIVLKNGASFSEEDYLAFLRSRLSSHKIPSRTVLFDAFPYHANGKLDQKQLEEALLSRLS